MPPRRLDAPQQGEFDAGTRHHFETREEYDAFMNKWAAHNKQQAVEHAEENREWMRNLVDENRGGRQQLMPTGSSAVGSKCRP